MTDDDKLRGLLRVAHADDDPPPFRAPERRPRAHRAMFAIAAASTVAVALAAWLWWGRGSATAPSLSPDPAPPIATRDYAIPEIESPTDFLLAVPGTGTDVLSTTPTFGAESDLTKGTSL
jgi:hypothetical protein